MMSRYTNCDGRVDKRGLVVFEIIERMRGQKWTQDELEYLIEDVSEQFDTTPMNKATVLLLLDVLGELTIERPAYQSHYSCGFSIDDVYGVVDKPSAVDRLLDVCETTELVSFPADAVATVTGVLKPSLVEWMHKGLRDCLPDETRVLEASDETTYMVKDGRVMVEMRLPVSLLDQA